MEGGEKRGRGGIGGGKDRLELNIRGYVDQGN